MGIGKRYRCIFGIQCNRMVDHLSQQILTVLQKQTFHLIVHPPSSKVTILTSIDLIVLPDSELYINIIIQNVNLFLTFLLNIVSKSLICVAVIQLYTNVSY